jgi:hypothetical protein
VLLEAGVLDALMNGPPGLLVVDAWTPVLTGVLDADVLSAASLMLVRTPPVMDAGAEACETCIAAFA